MKILIVADDSTARHALREQLRDRAVVDVSIEEAPAEMKARPPHVLLFLLPEANGPELLRGLCAADTTGAIYVICVVPETHPARAVSSAFAAGCHDVLRAPFGLQELRSRINVRQRLRRWITNRLRLEEASKSQRIPTVVELLCSWQNLGDVIADDLESLLGRSLIIEENWPEFGNSLQLAAISMTLASEQLELCISIAADARARSWLGENLLGDPAAPDEALDDVMREMANISGGALKRAALAEGPVLSTGIPVDGRSLPERDSGARCWTVPVAEGVTIAVIGEVRRRANRQIPARRLIEGMIVVKDVLSHAGVLLLPGGTRLTSTTASRLSNLLDLTLVEVVA